jgi:hypothetical protein
LLVACTDQAAGDLGLVGVPATHQAAEQLDLMGAAATDQAAEQLGLVRVPATHQAAGQLDLMGAAATDKATEQLGLVGCAATDQATQQLYFVGITATDKATMSDCLAGCAATDQSPPGWSFCPARNIDASYQRSWLTVACVAKLDTFMAPDNFDVGWCCGKTAVTPGLPRVL